MKRLLQTFVLIVSAIGSLHAQTPITITSPSGLEEAPYEVAAGTSVTFQVDFSGATPEAFFTSPTEPVFPALGADPSWHSITDFTDNGNGTYSITLVVNEPVYVWAGLNSDFIGWTFSGMTSVSIASGVELSYPTGFLCSTGTNSEVLSVKGTYASYQWYRGGEPIPGATSANYTATEVGAYKVQVPLGGKSVFSNTLHLKSAYIDFSGTLSGANVTVKAPAGMDSYTWISGSSETAMTPVNGATDATFTFDLPAQTKYYAVIATKAGCEIQSMARAASTARFAKPAIDVTAPISSGGKICPGTTATLSVADTYGTYTWFLDGDFYYGDGHTNTTADKTGNFRADVTPRGWPEITLSSDNKKVGYYNIIAPNLDLDHSGTYCPGQTIETVLDNEGYEYHWYLHTQYNYTPADEVTPGQDINDYTFTFANAVNLTVVGKSAGCEVKSRYELQSYSDIVPYLGLSDYDQEYLCEGSSTDLIVNDAGQYASFTWYKDGKEITGKKAATYTVTTPGTYYVKAHPAACPASTNTSDPHVIRSYTERTFTLDADKDAMCEGDKATLTVPGGWNSIQWFEKTIVISDKGYKDEYVAIKGAPGTATYQAGKFTTYLVKAKHQSCPTGVKTWSEPFQIRPSINPDIKVAPWEGEPRRWHKAFFDSIPNYLFCDDAPLAMTVDAQETYDTYEWYMKPYNGDGDYTPGNKIDGESADHLNINAFGARWYTARITSGNCVGYSDAVLIDTWVHASPDIAAVGNAELCGEDDTLPLSVAYEGNWVRYEWYKDDELVPDSNVPTLNVTEPGGYILMAYPEECPNIGYSSGLPIYVDYFPQSEIFEEAGPTGNNDDYIYAWPWEGYYQFQWYLDGKPITVVNNEDASGPYYELDTNTDTEDDFDYPYLYKRRMPSGEYTVIVSNWEDCSSTSLGFTWTAPDPGTGPVTGINPEKETIGLAIHPNPTDGTVTLQGATKDQIKAVGVTSAHGQPVTSYFNAADQSIDLSSLSAGVYIVEITLNNNSKKSLRVLRK